MLGMGVLHSRLVDSSQILRAELLHGMIMRQTDINCMPEMPVVDSNAASYQQTKCGE